MANNLPCHALSVLDWILSHTAVISSHYYDFPHTVGFSNNVCCSNNWKLHFFSYNLLHLIKSLLLFDVLFVTF